jgi:hypothetical protein
LSGLAEEPTVTKAVTVATRLPKGVPVLRKLERVERAREKSASALDPPKASLLAPLTPRFDEGPAEPRAGEQAVAPIGAGGHEWPSAAFKRASVLGQGKNLIGGQSPQEKWQSHEHALRLPSGYCFEEGSDTGGQGGGKNGGNGG